MNKVIASGAIFYSRSTQRILVLQKAYGKHSMTWGICGGKNLEEENPWQGLCREVIEEIGFLPVILKTIPLETFVSNDTVFNFHTYLCIIEEEFIPILSSEHCGWAWTRIDTLPRPLHQGLKNSLSNKIILSKLQTVFDLLELI